MSQEHKWDSYFDHINWRVVEIDHATMTDAISMVQEVLKKDVIKIIKIMKRNPKVFRLELNDQTNLRFDRFPYDDVHLNMIKLHEIILKNYDCVPKIISYKKVGKKILKLSEWIDGYLWAEVSHIEKVNKNIGEIYAKINNLQDPKTGLFITIGEINNTSTIWTENETPVIVDLGTIRCLNKGGIDHTVYKNLVKRVVYKDRIDVFLDGYSKHRDISGILELAKKHNWTFGKRKARGCVTTT